MNEGQFEAFGAAGQFHRQRDNERPPRRDLERSQHGLSGSDHEPLTRDLRRKDRGMDIEPQDGGAVIAQQWKRQFALRADGPAERFSDDQPAPRAAKKFPIFPKT
jgi:hypothetical protein